MLKKRIIAVLPVYNGIVVQSIGFHKYLPVGKAEIAIEFLNAWGIDEIVVADITARKNQRVIQPGFIKQISKKCLVPLTVGGGITRLEDVHELIHSGADKVCVNNPVLTNPGLISEIARNYGDQCVVASIDIIRENNSLYVWDYTTKTRSTQSVAQVLQTAIQAGAGELLINSVHNDGKYTGYDTELFTEVCNQVTVPVLACGGARNAESMIQLLNATEVSAACAGNFFHFFEHSVTITKKEIAKHSDAIRIETAANYKQNEVDAYGRLIKKDDAVLEHLLYLKIEKEII
jgi:cyclase